MESNGGRDGVSLVEAGIQFLPPTQLIRRQNTGRNGSCGRLRYATSATALGKVCWYGILTLGGLVDGGLPVSYRKKMVVMLFSGSIRMVTTSMKSGLWMTGLVELLLLS